MDDCRVGGERAKALQRDTLCATSQVFQILNYCLSIRTGVGVLAIERARDDADHIDLSRIAPVYLSAQHEIRICRPPGDAVIQKCSGQVDSGATGEIQNGRTRTISQAGVLGYSGGLAQQFTISRPQALRS